MTIPHPEGAPVFAEPWEAQAFALTLALHERGVFSWPEWAQALGEQIALAQRAGDADLGGTYYRHWLAALESIVASKGLAGPDTLRHAREAWARAAERTPHGRPIVLSEEDFTPD